MNELSISNKYPPDKYNLLGNTDVIATIPDIKSLVIQAVKLDTDPKNKEVYIQQRGNANTPDLYAIAKNGLNKLAERAGIDMVSSEHVIPSTCQKCIAVNQHCGKVIQCGNCNNKDVAYCVTISVPQLTGEVLTIKDTNETIVENVTPGMTSRQKAEFMKHLPQICETKALNGAIRTALHIKGTYTLEELQKPFVVAYLVPNLNHQEVKKAAIENMFQSSVNLFGNIPSVQQIESRVPESSAIEAADGENYDAYIDGTYKEDIPDNKTEADNNVIQQDYYCDKCGEPVTQKVWNYSVDNFERPLCYKCQKLVRNEQGGAGR